MALGAYAIVRFANDVRDERLNLGVLVWHPSDGFRFRFLSSLERVKAIDPDVRLKSIQDTMKGIRDRSSMRDASRDLFESLSDEFREGVQVGAVYPARLSGLDATADQLYSLLVEYPADVKPEFVDFQLRLASSIEQVGREVDPGGTFHDEGKIDIGGVKVNVGIRTMIKNSETLWRGVSLKTNAIEDQLARAKAAAADIGRISSLERYKKIKKMVVMEKPRMPRQPLLDECAEWIKTSGANYMFVTDVDHIPAVIRTHLLPAA